MIGIGDIIRQARGNENDPAAQILARFRAAFVELREDLALSGKAERLAQYAGTMGLETWNQMAASTVTEQGMRLADFLPEFDDWTEMQDRETARRSIAASKLAEDTMRHEDALGALLAGAELGVKARHDQPGFAAYGHAAVPGYDPRRLVKARFAGGDLLAGEIYLQAPGDCVRVVPLFWAEQDGSVTDLARITSVVSRPPAHIAGAAE